MKKRPLWWEGTLKQRFPTFDSSKLNYADVVIIGGGLTGLSAAYQLKSTDEYKDKKIVVLEAGVIGSGATGISGGFLAPSTEADIIDVIHEFGRKGGENFWKLKTRLARMLVELIDRHGISCDLKNTGSLYLQTDSSKRLHKYFRKEAELRKQFGYKTELLTREQLGKILKTTESFYGGIYNQNEFCINPMLFLLGFAKVCSNMGVNIFELSRVLKVKYRNGKNIVRTEKGEIIADIVVYSCWTNIKDFVDLKKAEISYTFLAATPQLPDEILRELGDRSMQEGLMMWDSVPPPKYTYFRMIGKRLLFGGIDTFTKSQKKVEESYRLLCGAMLRYFPPLQRLQEPFEYFWDGDLVTMGFDELPIIGSVKGTNLKQIYAAGPGLLFAFLAGIIAKDWITRKASKETEILNSLDKKFFSKRKIAGMFPRVTKFLLDKFIFK